MGLEIDSRNAILLNGPICPQFAQPGVEKSELIRASRQMTAVFCAAFETFSCERMSGFD